MLHFILMYAFILLLTAVAINGIYNITRGRWEVLPDNTKKWSGKIFSGYSRFLQQHTIYKDFYKDGEWIKEFARLTAFFKKEDIIEVMENGLVVMKMDKITEAYFISFMAVNSISFTTRPYGSGTLIKIYKETKKYRLPELLRAPLGECLACMSSFWGTLLGFCWYQTAGIIQNIYPTAAVKVLQGLPAAGIVFLWVFFCLSLAYLNETIFNINHKLSS